MWKDTLRWHVLTCPLRSSVAATAAEEGKRGRGSHQQQHRSSGPSYQKVSGHLSRGVVFIVPPGRPIITIASKNQNLQIVCFDVNALNNEKFPLAVPLFFQSWILMIMSLARWNQIIDAWIDGV